MREVNEVLGDTRWCNALQQLQKRRRLPANFLPTSLQSPQDTSFPPFHPLYRTMMAPSRAPFICARCTRSLQTPTIRTPSRLFATASTPHRTRATTPPSRTSSSEQLPRWRQTPKPMQMPIRLRPAPKQPLWRVNDQQEPLDEMYDAFVGSAGRSASDIEGSRRGRDLLPEEIKVFTCVLRRK